MIVHRDKQIYIDAYIELAQIYVFIYIYLTSIVNEEMLAFPSLVSVYRNRVLEKQGGNTMGFYDYSVTDAQGNEVKMESFKGKVVLVVNTATGCGFTPHYKDIEAMYEKLHDKGLEILDIPCNQFAGQTPGTDEEIHEFCQLHYNTMFPQMKKSDVNGEGQLPLYEYLKSQKGFEGFGKSPAALAMGVMLKKIDKDYKNNPDIKWNFTKFVVDREGNVVARFEPTADMKKVAEFVEGLI